MNVLRMYRCFDTFFMIYNH